MVSYIGFGLLVAVIVGGIYLYMKVERLGKEIAQQGGDLDDEFDEKEA